MGFLSDMKDVLENEFNVSVTENGAIGFKTSGDALLDLNYKVSSLRMENNDSVVKNFAKAYFDDKIIACKWLFFAGDVRGGMGERRLFRLCFRFIASVDPEIAKELIPLVAEYTRWDNLFMLIKTPIEYDMLDYVKNQFEKDLEDAQNNKTISLLAKWLPSINSKCLTTKFLAKIISAHFGLTAKEYRKKLATLRTYLDVSEKKMSNKEWSEIDYEKVPSKANLIYSEAFLKNDKERRNKYLKDLEEGNAKINSSVTYPYEIVHKYLSSYYDVKNTKIELEEMWKALPDYTINQETSNTICVVDGSGSMYTTIPNTSVRCSDVANSLGIYFAEKIKGEFNNTFITFSNEPQIVEFSNCKSLKDKIAKIMSYNEIASTNIEKVFDLILTTAVKHKMKQEDLPATILILSDMEFNNAVSFMGKDKERLFEVIAEKYEKYGFKLPRLVFWNMLSRSKTLPVSKNELGVALVSGFSPSIAEMVFSSELNPLKVLLNKLNSERYMAIQEKLEKFKI